MSPVVAHLKTKYLGLSETFVHAYLSHANRHTPLVLTDVARNLAAFPAECRWLMDEERVQELREELGDGFGTFMEDFFRRVKFPLSFDRLVREQGVNLLHAHFGDMGYNSLGLKQKTGLPLVTSFYGIDASKLPSVPGWKGAFAELFRQGNCFTALGSNMRARLAALGCPEEKLRIVRLGVDLERIGFRERPAAGPVRLLYAGRLVEKKRTLDALEAFRMVADIRRDVAFVIVGDGYLRPSLELRIRQLSLQNRVALRGALSHEETLREMQEADLFILPSATAKDGDMEGTPTVLMEAQASGLPVVSTVHADIPEVVVDGTTGLLARERDVGGLARHLKQLLDEPGRRAEMGAAGRKHVEEHYNIRREVEKLEEVYEEVLQRA